MTAVRTFPLVALAAVIALAACGKDDVPQYVAGPISGLQYDCEQAHQPVPAATAYITRADMDGDGKPDHFVDTAKGCAANRLLYCGADGCRVSLYLSTWASIASPSFRAVSFAPVTRSGRAEVDVRSGGPGCAAQPDKLCQRSLVFNGTDLVASSGR